jgi:hypothetical protein
VGGEDKRLTMHYASVIKPWDNFALLKKIYLFWGKNS